MSEVWSAIMVRDVIYNMAEFAARKCEGWDDNEDWDYTTENPEITDAEMEQSKSQRPLPDTSRPARCTSPSTPRPENSPRPPSTKWTRKTK